MKVFPPRDGEPLFDRKKLIALLIPLIFEQVLSAMIGIAAIGASFLLSLWVVGAVSEHCLHHEISPVHVARMDLYLLAAAVHKSHSEKAEQGG